MKFKNYFIFLICVFLISCKIQSDEEVFNKFVQRKSVTDFLILQTMDVTPLESLDKDYRRIIENTANRTFLFEKAKSEKETQWCIPILMCSLTEGDVAICMLCDMYKMSDEYFENVMYENVEGEAGTKNAGDFWNYVHESPEHRDEIIQKTMEWVNLYRTSDLIISEE